jgi:hypothetical protein
VLRGCCSWMRLFQRFWFALRPGRTPRRFTSPTQGHPLHGRLQQLCCLDHCSDYYRPERQVAGRESHPLKIHAFARHTATPALHLNRQTRTRFRWRIDHIELIHVRPIRTEQAGMWHMCLLPPLTRCWLQHASTTITLPMSSRISVRRRGIQGFAAACSVESRPTPAPILRCRLFAGRIH